MARQSNYPTDNNIVGPDRILGLNEAGDTVNFTISGVSNYITRSGGGTGANAVLAYDFVLPNADPVTEVEAGRMTVEGFDSTNPDYSSVTNLILSTETLYGTQSDPLLEQFADNTITLTGFGGEEDLTYAIFTVTSVDDTSIPGAVRLEVTYENGTDSIENGKQSRLISGGGYAIAHLSAPKGESGDSVIVDLEKGQLFVVTSNSAGVVPADDLTTTTDTLRIYIDGTEVQGAITGTPGEMEYVVTVGDATNVTLADTPLVVDGKSVNIAAITAFETSENLGSVPLNIVINDGIRTFDPIVVDLTYSKVKQGVAGDPTMETNFGTEAPGAITIGLSAHSLTVNSATTFTQNVNVGTTATTQTKFTEGTKDVAQHDILAADADGNFVPTTPAAVHADTESSKDFGTAAGDSVTLGDTGHTVTIQGTEVEVHSDLQIGNDDTAGYYKLIKGSAAPAEHQILAANASGEFVPTTVSPNHADTESSTDFGTTATGTVTLGNTGEETDIIATTARVSTSSTAGLNVIGNISQTNGGISSSGNISTSGDGVIEGQLELGGELVIGDTESLTSYSFPTARGTENQALILNDSGDLGFQTISGDHIDLTKETDFGTDTSSAVTLGTAAHSTTLDGSLITLGAFSIPTGTGSANQVLTTDGSGASTWTDVSGDSGHLATATHFGTSAADTVNLGTTSETTEIQGTNVEITTTGNIALDGGNVNIAEELVIGTTTDAARYAIAKGSAAPTARQLLRYDSTASAFVPDDEQIVSELHEFGTNVEEQVVLGDPTHSVWVRGSHTYIEGQFHLNVDSADGTGTNSVTFPTNRPTEDQVLKANADGSSLRWDTFTVDTTTANNIGTAYTGSSIFIGNASQPGQTVTIDRNTSIVGDVELGHRTSDDDDAQFGIYFGPNRFIDDAVGNNIPLHWAGGLDIPSGGSVDSFEGKVPVLKQREGTGDDAGKYIYDVEWTGDLDDGFNPNDDQTIRGQWKFENNTSPSRDHFLDVEHINFIMDQENTANDQEGDFYRFALADGSDGANIYLGQSFPRRWGDNTKQIDGADAPEGHVHGELGSINFLSDLADNTVRDFTAVTITGYGDDVSGDLDRVKGRLDIVLEDRTEQSSNRINTHYQFLPESLTIGANGASGVTRPAIILKGETSSQDITLSAANGYKLLEGVRTSLNSADEGNNYIISSTSDGSAEVLKTYDTPETGDAGSYLRVDPSDHTSLVWHDPFNGEINWNGHQTFSGGFTAHTNGNRFTNSGENTIYFANTDDTGNLAEGYHNRFNLNYEFETHIGSLHEFWDSTQIREGVRVKDTSPYLFDSEWSVHTTKWDANQPANTQPSRNKSFEVGYEYIAVGESNEGRIYFGDPNDSNHDAPYIDHNTADAIYAINDIEYTEGTPRAWIYVSEKTSGVDSLIADELVDWTATDSRAGVVKIGNGIDVSNDGTISVTQDVLGQVHEVTGGVDGDANGLYARPPGCTGDGNNCGDCDYIWHTADIANVTGDSNADNNGLYIWTGASSWCDVSTASDWSKLNSDVDVNLGYTASATNGIVTNSGGTNATIPLATGDDAGLMPPSLFNTASTLPNPATETEGDYVLRIVGTGNDKTYEWEAPIDVIPNTEGQTGKVLTVENDTTVAWEDAPGQYKIENGGTDITNADGDTINFGTGLQASYDSDSTTYTASVNLAASDIPPLPGSIISSGEVDEEHIPTLGLDKLAQSGAVTGQIIEWGGDDGWTVGDKSNYTLDVATADDLGGIKIGPSFDTDTGSNADQLLLNVATADLLGGVKVAAASDIDINSDGFLTLGSIDGATKINGSSITLNKLAQSSATNGQIIKWNDTNSAWEAADETGGGNAFDPAGDYIVTGDWTFAGDNTKKFDVNRHINVGEITAVNNVVDFDVRAHSSDFRITGGTGAADEPLFEIASGKTIADNLVIGNQTFNTLSSGFDTNTFVSQKHTVITANDNVDFVAKTEHIYSKRNADGSANNPAQNRTILEMDYSNFIVNPNEAGIDIVLNGDVSIAKDGSAVEIGNVDSDVSIGGALSITAATNFTGTIQRGGDTVDFFDPENTGDAGEVLTRTATGYHWAEESGGAGNAHLDGGDDADPQTWTGFNLYQKLIRLESIISGESADLDHIYNVATTDAETAIGSTNYKADLGETDPDEVIGVKAAIYDWTTNNNWKGSYTIEANSETGGSSSTTPYVFSYDNVDLGSNVISMSNTGATKNKITYEFPTQDGLPSDPSNDYLKVKTWNNTTKTATLEWDSLTFGDISGTINQIPGTITSSQLIKNVQLTGSEDEFRIATGTGNANRTLGFVGETHYPSGVNLAEDTVLGSFRAESEINNKEIRTIGDIEIYVEDIDGTDSDQNSGGIKLSVQDNTAGSNVKVEQVDIKRASVSIADHLVVSNVVGNSGGVKIGNYEMPRSAGDNNDVLTINGSGNAEWQTAPAWSSVTLDGTDYFNSLDNLRLGSTRTLRNDGTTELNGNVYFNFDNLVTEDPNSKGQLYRSQENGEGPWFIKISDG